MMTFAGLTHWLGSVAPTVADHLWQSTLFAIAMAALTLSFQRNQAAVRFWLWFAASIKFLVPLSLLVSLGGLFASRSVESQSQTNSFLLIEQVGQPFTHATAASGRMAALLAILPILLAAVWLLGTATVLVLWVVRWQRVSALTHTAEPLVEGREVETLGALERMSGIRERIALLASAESMEPAVFGILRPVLLWPKRISEQLSDAQLRSILAHELWHVRRQDNLMSAIHMFVEAVFWFNPVAWWIGAKLVEERERACDEEVLRLGNKADVYAESILKACRFCLESPLTCVSGVAVANVKNSGLKRRISRIMNGQSSQKLTLVRRVILAAAAVSVVAGPIVFGAMHAPRLQAQAMQGPNSLSAAINAPAAAFDTITIKPAGSVTPSEKILIQIGDHTFTSNSSVKDLIKFAYGVEMYQIEDAPDWTGSDRYDIVATWKDAHGYKGKVEGMPGPPPPPPPPPPGASSAPSDKPFGSINQYHLAPFQIQAMVQNLLVTKFNLKFSSQMKDSPVYDLVVASGGAKLMPTPKDPPPPSFSGEQIISVRTTFKSGHGELNLSNGPVAALAGFLSGQLDHQVLDKTGIQGNYNIALHWTPDGNVTSAMGQSLEDQLGLKLEPQHAPVKVMTVSQVDKPVED